MVYKLCNKVYVVYKNTLSLKCNKTNNNNKRKMKNKTAGMKF